MPPRVIGAPVEAGSWLHFRIPQAPPGNIHLSSQEVCWASRRQGGPSKGCPADLRLFRNKSLIQGVQGISSHCGQGRNSAVRRCKVFNTHLKKKLNCFGASDWWCSWQHACFPKVSSLGFWTPRKGWGPPLRGLLGGGEPACHAWPRGWAVAGPYYTFRDWKLWSVLLS